MNVYNQYFKTLTLYHTWLSGRIFRSVYWTLKYCFPIMYMYITPRSNTLWIIGWINLMIDNKIMELMSHGNRNAFYYSKYKSQYSRPIQCVPQKRKPINRVNFSENCNDLSEKAYIFTKFSLSSFFWHQLQDVLAMHEQALTISNGDVKNYLRRMGI